MNGILYYINGSIQSKQENEISRGKRMADRWTHLEYFHEQKRRINGTRLNSTIESVRAKRVLNLAASTSSNFVSD